MTASFSDCGMIYEEAAAYINHHQYHRHRGGGYGDSADANNYHNNRGDSSSSSSGPVVWHPMPASMKYPTAMSSTEAGGWATATMEASPSATLCSIAPASIADAVGVLSGVEGSNTPLLPVELQVSNLDQNIDAREMKKILLTFFREYVMVLHVSMLVQNDGNLAASLRVPSAQDAQYAISQLHRKKIGSKRIIISYVNHNQPSPELKRSKVISLLQEVPGRKLPLFKFRELYERRYHETIGVSEMYNMRDVVTVSDNSVGRMITLNPEYNEVTPVQLAFEDPSGVSRFCSKHSSGPDTSIGWAERDDVTSLPNVELSLDTLKETVPDLLTSHNGVLPLASLVECYTAQFGPLKESIDSGVPLEHLVSCLPFVSIDTSGDGFKFVQWSENKPPVDDLEELAKFVSPPLIGQIALFSRELVDLLKTFPHTRLPFSRFIPAYHHHFGRQCRVADYGFTKLADLFDALPHVVQVLGEGNKKLVTLAHRAQVKRFSSDLLRVLKTQPAKVILMSQMPPAYEKVVGKKWDITDYGVNYLDDILSEVSESTVLVTKEVDDIMLEIPRREQTPDEVEKTRQFGAEVVELLRHSPQCQMQFNRFIPAYHHHFGRQCRVSDYGFSKLIDLFEAIPDLLHVFDDEDGEKQLQLAEKERMRVLGEQVMLVVKGAPKQNISVNDLNQVFTHYFGCTLRPQVYGYESLDSLLSSLTNYVKVSGSGDDAMVTVVDQAVARRELSRVRSILWEEDSCSMPLKKFNEIYFEKHGSTPDVTLLTSRSDMNVIVTEDGDEETKIKLSGIQIFAKDVVSLLEDAGGRMLLANFESAYFEKFGTHCRPARYGYASFVALVQSLPDLVVIRGRGTKKILLLASKDISYRSSFADSLELTIDMSAGSEDVDIEQNKEKPKLNGGDASPKKIVSKEKAGTKVSNLSQDTDDKYKNLTEMSKEFSKSQSNCEKGKKSTSFENIDDAKDSIKNVTHCKSSTQTKVVVETIKCTSVTATIVNATFTKHEESSPPGKTQNDARTRFRPSSSIPNGLNICKSSSEMTNGSRYPKYQRQILSGYENCALGVYKNGFTNGHNRWNNFRYPRNNVPNVGQNMSRRSRTFDHSNVNQAFRSVPVKNFVSTPTPPPYLGIGTNGSCKENIPSERNNGTNPRVGIPCGSSSKSENIYYSHTKHSEVRETGRKCGNNSTKSGGFKYQRNGMQNSFAHIRDKYNENETSGEMVNGGDQRNGFCQQTAPTSSPPSSWGSYYGVNSGATQEDCSTEAVKDRIRRTPGHHRPYSQYSKTGYTRRCSERASDDQPPTDLFQEYINPSQASSCSVPIPPPMASRGQQPSVTLPEHHLSTSPTYDFQACLPDGSSVLMSVPPPHSIQSSSLMFGSPVAATAGGTSVMWGQIWSPGLQYPHVIASPISPAAHYVIPPGMSVSWGSIATSPPSLNLPPPPPLVQAPTQPISMHTLDHSHSLDYSMGQSSGNIQSVPMVSQSSGQMISQPTPLLHTSSFLTESSIEPPQPPILSLSSAPLYDFTASTIGTPSSTSSFPSFTNRAMTLFPTSEEFSDASPLLGSTPSLATTISPIINPDLGVEIVAPLIDSTPASFSQSSSSAMITVTDKAVGGAVSSSQAAPISVS